MVLSDSENLTLDALCAKSREAILAIADKVLELAAPGTIYTNALDSQIQRLLLRLSWHMGFWKSYGTRDTADRAQAGANLIGQTVIMGKGGRWNDISTILYSTLETINSMALVPDKNRLSPLVLQQLYGQIDADLKVVRIQFSARAARS